MLLSSLKKGKTAVVLHINSTDDIRVRLYDMGLIEGTKIKSMFISPSKRINAYLFRNSIIAIRDKDANNIIVEEVYD